MRRKRQDMAARLWIEPRQNESESFVLPLHHRAVKKIVDFSIEMRRLEPAMGFEPATACLQNRCSTIELRRQKPGRWPKFDWEKTEKWWLPGDSNPEPID